MSVHYDGLAGEHPTRKNLSSVAQGIAEENNWGVNQRLLRNGLLFRLVIHFSQKDFYEKNLYENIAFEYIQKKSFNRMAS